MRQSFDTYTPKSAVLALVLGFIIMIPSAAIIVFYSDQLFVGTLVPGFISLFFLYVLVMSVIKLFTSYTVTSNSLILTKPPFYKRVVKPEDINHVALLTTAQTSQLMARSVERSNAHTENHDLADYVGTLKKDIPLFRYFTNVPKPFITGIQDIQETIPKEHWKSSGRAVILVLSNNKVLYLSPKDPEGFVNEVQKLLGDNPTLFS